MASTPVALASQFLFKNLLQRQGIPDNVIKGGKQMDIDTIREMFRNLSIEVDTVSDECFHDGSASCGQRIRVRLIYRNSETGFTETVSEDHCYVDG